MMCAVKYVQVKRVCEFGSKVLEKCHSVQRQILQGHRGSAACHSSAHSQAHPLQSKDHGQLSTSPRGSHSLCRKPGTDPETNANLCSLSLSNQPTTFTEFFFFFFPRPTYIGKAAVTSSFWGHYTYSCLASLLSELRPWTRQHHQACCHKKSKRKSQRDSCPGGLSTRGNLRSFRMTLFRQPAKR